MFKQANQIKPFFFCILQICGGKHTNALKEMSEPLKIFKQLDGIKSVLEKRKTILSGTYIQSEKISREERMPAGRRDMLENGYNYYWNVHQLKLID
uniref:Uncharacterized protein n=1 Tax=Zea mays TaxID=4577 RepID=B4FFA4_MAIZE|nr:unknown [Zea mays]